MASSETPSWLKTDNDNAVDNYEMTEPASTPASAPEPNTTATTTTTTTPSGGDDAEDQELPGVILTMRLANMGVAILIVVISVRIDCNIVLIVLLCFDILML